MVVPHDFCKQDLDSNCANFVGVVWGAERSDSVPSMGLGTAVGSGSNKGSLARVKTCGAGAGEMEHLVVEHWVCMQENPDSTPTIGRKE